MSDRIKISTALISVFNKEGLEPIINYLGKEGIDIISTGGTQNFIESQGVRVTPVESITDYQAIFGGRVKTLHPVIFGGILARRQHPDDQRELTDLNISPIDLVIVDLYPFQETVASGGSEEEIIEKIDIGGIALIRAAAKNHRDVLVVSSRNQYPELLDTLKEHNGQTTLKARKWFAIHAFNVTSDYDSAIYDYFAQEDPAKVFKARYMPVKSLRYGENPHQRGMFYGNLEEVFDQLHGKEISYNNLVDIDAAVDLIQEFNDYNAFAILKHTNACGLATGEKVLEAYHKAFAADTISAFGGVLITNATVDLPAAQKINELFFEVLIAPAFDQDALDVLKSKKNRILLIKKEDVVEKRQFKTLLNGVVTQDKDMKTDKVEDLKTVTQRSPTEKETQAMIFANKIVKHTKSNAIVLATDSQLIASGVGQTSRVDALKQAIAKGRSFGFGFEGVVMASDAFFPFPDCVEIAQEVGIKAVIQPGGSIRDQASIDFCNEHEMVMVFTGTRHFKH